MSGEQLEIVVRVEHGYRHANGRGADQAVDQFPNRLAAATTSAVKSGGLFIIDGLRREKRSACQESAKVPQVLLVPSPRKQLHANGITGGNIGIE